METPDPPPPDEEVLSAQIIERLLRYDELEAAVLRSTRAFIAAGIESGARVSIWAPNIHEWILAALGLQSAGAVLVPLKRSRKLVLLT